MALFFWLLRQYSYFNFFAASWLHCKYLFICLSTSGFSLYHSPLNMLCSQPWSISHSSEFACHLYVDNSKCDILYSSSLYWGRAVQSSCLLNLSSKYQYFSSLCPAKLPSLFLFPIAITITSTYLVKLNKYNPEAQPKLPTFSSLSYPVGQEILLILLYHISWSLLHCLNDDPSARFTVDVQRWLLKQWIPLPSAPAWVCVHYFFLHIGMHSQ